MVVLWMAKFYRLFYQLRLHFIWVASGVEMQTYACTNTQTDTYTNTHVQAYTNTYTNTLTHAYT